MKLISDFARVRITLVPRIENLNNFKTVGCNVAQQRLHMTSCRLECVLMHADLYDYITYECSGSALCNND
jgi:hypothetical protein